VKDRPDIAAFDGFGSELTATRSPPQYVFERRPWNSRSFELDRLSIEIFLLL
jgi:hypothetical protein